MGVKGGKNGPKVAKMAKLVTEGGQQTQYNLLLPIKAALADRKKVVKTGSIFMGRGRVMGRGSAESRLRGMGRGSVGAWLRGMGGGSAGEEFRGMDSRAY